MFKRTTILMCAVAGVLGCCSASKSTPHKKSRMSFASAPDAGKPPCPDDAVPPDFSCTPRP